MKIDRKRVNNIDKLLILIGDNSFKVQAKVEDIELLKAIGFNTLDIGTSIVPKAIGSISKFNLNGKEVVIVPKEEEYVTHTIPYEVKDWHGNWHSGYYDRVFKRYKRKFIEGPKVKITITSNENNTYTVSSNLLSPQDNRDSIKHNINLMLELFKAVEITDSNDNPITKEKQVPWVILPPGEYPWPIFYSSVKHSLRGISSEELEELKDRYEFIQKLEPICTISGKNGFLGYYIAEFKNGIYICDSMFKNNAIYIFDSNWEALSQLTKKDIISGSLAIDRIIHKNNWKTKVVKQLKINGAI